MKPSVLLNELLTKGAILGIVILLFRIIDVSILVYAQGVMRIGVQTAISIASSVVNIYLLYRFTRDFANKVVYEYKTLPQFTYGNGLSYVVYISALSAIIAAFGSWVFIHHIVGYETYIESMQGLFGEMVSRFETLMPANSASYDIQQELNKAFASLRDADAPTFIDTILDNTLISMLRGCMLGLIIAAFTRRKPISTENSDE